MPFIDLVSEDTDDEAAGALLARERERVGYVPNYARALALRPQVYEAWVALVTAVRSSLDSRRYELATLAAAKRMRSTYCMLAHGSALAKGLLPEETVVAAARDHHEADLEPVEVAVMDLAEKVAGDATSITGEDVERLRRLGLADREIADVVFAAAARAFFTKTMDALGVQADARYAAMPAELREPLVVGRPIEPQ